MKPASAANAMVICLGAFVGAIAGELVQERAALGPIAIGDLREDVQKKLGLPVSTEEGAGMPVIHWRYDGVDIQFRSIAPYRVTQIVTSDARFCTASGVCPGSPLSQVVGRLGVPRETSLAMDGPNTFSVDIEACWLEVEMLDSAAHTLAIRCQP